MNNERDAWERLITLEVLSPDSQYSPTRAKEGWYSAMLREQLRAIDEKASANKTQGRLPKVRSTKDLLEQLDKFADELLDPKSEVPQPDRQIHLREKAHALGVTLRDADLQRKLWEARRRRCGGVGVITPGMTIDAPEAVWAWESLLMAGDSNLLLALPKVGKTTLVVAAIAAWHYGTSQYLGHHFHGPCPAVVIAGTDMPRSRWLPLLGRFGLAEKIGEGQWRLPDDGPVKALFTQSEAVYLDHAGINRIVEEVSKWSGCLLLVDSYAKCVGPLGLKESDSLFAAPLGDLQEGVAPFDVTSVVIHHSGHGRRGEGAVAASRGTTALPAAVSQVISLGWFNREKNSVDKRVLLQTEGRGGEPQQLLIEQHESGWTSHGDAQTVLRQQAQEAEEGKLTDTQAEVLELVRSRAEGGGKSWEAKTNYRVLREELKIPDRQALRVLRSREKKGFLKASHESSDIGSSIWFVPT